MLVQQLSCAELDRAVDDVVAADGARYALVSKVEPGGIEVAIDGDRYRLPAMLRKRAS